MIQKIKNRLQNDKKYRRKLLLVGVLFLGLLGAGLFTLIRPAMARETYVYKEETVSRGDLVLGITESGSLTFTQKQVDYDLALSLIYEEDEEEDEGEEDFPEYEYGEYSKMTLTTLKKDGSGVKKAVSNTYEKKATGVKTSKLRSLKSTKKGTVELSWKKNAKATGYEIYMSNKKSSGYKKVATIKNNNTVKYIKKKLKSGEKFFFKIRAYVVKKKVKTFTKYSAVKSITVK